jgi:hypothetical protein
MAGSAVRSPLLLAGLERLHRLRDPPRPGLWSLRLFDPADEALAVERCQRLEEADGLRLRAQSRPDILGQGGVLRALGSEIYLDRRSVLKVGVPTPRRAELEVVAPVTSLRQRAADTVPGDGPGDMVDRLVSPDLVGVEGQPDRDSPACATFNCCYDAGDCWPPVKFGTPSG